MSSGGPLSFEQFIERLADLLDLDPESFQSEARFIEDLGLDSFDLVEILTFVENVGAHLPDGVAEEVETVGDLYREYRSRVMAGDLDDPRGSIA